MYLTCFRTRHFRDEVKGIGRLSSPFHVPHPASFHSTPAKPCSIINRIREGCEIGKGGQEEGKKMGWRNREEYGEGMNAFPPQSTSPSPEREEYHHDRHPLAVHSYMLRYSHCRV